jgi:uncharacterized protein YraI
MGGVRGRLLVGAVLAGLLAVPVVLVPAAPASAEPATPVAFPPGSSATRVAGPGFDTCTAPQAPAMQAWRASPYRTVNTYFGGVNRGCTQPSLAASWVSSVAAQGWRILPTYFGRQPSCTFSTKPYRYTDADAASYGGSEGADAVAKAKALGLRPGSALYADVEHYDVGVAACVTAVRRYVSAWTKRLHAAGYLAGVYVHQNSGARNLSQTYGSTTYARPDAIWVARWDSNSSLRGWPTVPDAQWSIHQRIKQYRGDHAETRGGVTINVDSDNLDAPVATVAYGYRVTSTTSLNARSGPATSYGVVRSYPPGSGLAVLCQTTGQKVGTTSVWDRLADGSFVTDYYVSTSSKTDFTSPLPRCSYPGQVTATDGLNARTGPGASYAVTRSPLPFGALAWVSCQRAGSTVGSTAVWDRLEDGRWVSDYYVSNASNTTYTAAIPRC